MTDQGHQATDEPATDDHGSGETPAGDADLAQLQAQLEAVKAESEQRLQGWQRAQADLENYRKHATQELADRLRGARVGLLMDLLAVVDDFERALAADHETDPQAWIEGVRLIEKKFYSFLEQQELSPIAAEHQRFDPNFHEALGQAPGPAGQVVAQLQKGYLLGERVLRPARVIVGSGEDPPAADGTQTNASANAD